MKTKAKLLRIITLLIIITCALSTAVFAVKSNIQSNHKIIEDEAIISELSKNFNKSSEDIVQMKNEQKDWNKVTYKLIVERENSIHNDNLINELYDQGYSIQDIGMAIDYSAICQKTPAEILDIKGKGERYELKKEKNEAGEEIEIGIDNNDKLWDAAVVKLGIDFNEYLDLLGFVEDSSITSLSTDYSNRQKYDIAMLALCFKKEMKDVVIGLKNGKKLDQLQKTYFREWLKENKIQISPKQEPKGDPKTNYDNILKKAYKITDEEITMFRQQGMDKLSDIAEAKHIAAKYKISTEKVIEIKKEQKDWEKVYEVLGGNE